ncbi:MAG: hypothetical protein ACRCSZ_04035 [Lactococcus lactis]
MSAIYLDSNVGTEEMGFFVGTKDAGTIVSSAVGTEVGTLDGSTVGTLLGTLLGTLVGTLGGHFSWFKWWDRDSGRKGSGEIE